ncbi:protein SYS1 homolog [Amphibalanus amphitrite]|uniref:protein SYS1 homolog n=1 Tax=Amphibalanus amphitrite TaxID=1232801 RepID=UPI001C91F601|nr:protein SYS1 homolog [Amphibalanus amphitrite]
MGGHFRHTKWDPFLIISQIVCLQALYYLGLGIWLILMNFITGDLLSSDTVFNYQVLNLSEGHGRIISTAYVLNALFSALALWWVVQRTKLCLDFSCTTLLYHVLLCWAVSGRWPASATWWLVQLVCLGLACVGGEFLCMRTELAAIPVGLGGGRVDL